MRRVRTADGFTVNVTNFDGEFTWVADVGGVLDGVLTVTGVDPGVEVTVTVTTLRDGYADGSATVTGAAREGALTPEFGAPVRTADGFTVNVTNFDSGFGWVPDRGAVSDGVLTVTDIAPDVEVTVTVTTLRDGYADGSATVTGAAREGAEAAPVDARTVLPSVTCSPLPAQVGSLVTCTVAGGVSGIDILWRVAFNPTVAGEGLTLDASGSGEFSFTVPVAALGQELTIELVDWAAPMSLGVPGGPVPTSVPSGEGPVTVWPLVLLLALAGGLVLRRGVCAQA